jgi:surface-anchored protein
MKKALLLTSWALSASVPAASLLTGGHMDGPAFGYVSKADVTADPSLTQGFEPHFHNEGGGDGAVIDGIAVEAESEYDPSDLVIVVPQASTIMVASTNYYWLPETEQDAAAEGAPFLGVGLEELVGTDWDGTLTISLNSINGPGHFRLWQDDGLGGANIFLDSADTSKSFFELLAGSHTHYNWGFTELGTYQLEFGISGTHVEDGLQSGSGTYTFLVPEPSTALLGALASIGLLRRRR